MARNPKRGAAAADSRDCHRAGSATPSAHGSSVFDHAKIKDNMVHGQHMARRRPRPTSPLASAARGKADPFCSLRAILSLTLSRHMEGLSRVREQDTWKIEPHQKTIIGNARFGSTCGRRPCKNFLTFWSFGRVRSRVRPVSAAGMAAGPNALRGSGPIAPAQPYLLQACVSMVVHRRD